MKYFMAALAILLAGCASSGGRAKPGDVVVDDTRCPAAAQMVQATDSDYGRVFLRRFSTRVAYPEEALSAGQTGTVQLCARLGRDGQVQDARIAAGSGFPLLDGAALLASGAMMSAKDREPMPPDFAPERKEPWIAFSVNFKPERPADQTYPREADNRKCKETGSKDGDAGAKAVSLEAWSGYPAEFSDAVKKELVYPRQALDASLTGVTLLCVSLDKDSRLLGVSVSQSSGSPLLDGASLIALGMMQLKIEIPYVPDRVRQSHDTVTFTQEIDWKLSKP
jgi:TonB family protein